MAAADHVMLKDKEGKDVTVYLKPDTKVVRNKAAMEGFGHLGEDADCDYRSDGEGQGERQAVRQVNRNGRRTGGEVGAQRPNVVACGQPVLGSHLGRVPSEGVRATPPASKGESR